MWSVKAILAAACVGMAAVAGADVQASAATEPAAPLAKKGTGLGRACAGPPQMAILGLEIQPDPAGDVVLGGVWNVQVRSDRAGECDTSLEIMDADRVAGPGTTHRILPGTNVYIVPLRAGYTFQPRDHCFVVRAEVGGAMVPVDSQRRFCARPIPGQPNKWTLR